MTAAELDRVLLYVREEHGPRASLLYLPDVPAFRVVGGAPREPAPAALGRTSREVDARIVSFFYDE